MLQVKFLGQFEIVLDGKRLNLSTRSAQSLFAYLVLNAGKAHRRELLAGLLWPDSSEENARSNLRHELWRMRKAIQPGQETYFLIDDLTISFHPQDEVYLDVHRLENVPTERSDANELTAALATYVGELLPGFYDEWVSAERQRLAVLFEAKMARLLEILQGEARWAEVLEWATRWIALAQWPEPAYRAIMTAYASIGDVSKVVETFERFALGLQRDLGVAPSEQTQALYQQIKAGRKPDVRRPAAKSPPSPAAPPEPAVLDHPLPRLRHSNLPKPLTSFIGRENEIQQVSRLVSEGRLVTITGSGGVGKTRLAIRVSDGLAPNFSDGVWWVELASLFEAGASHRTDLSKQPQLSYRRNANSAYDGLVELSEVDLVAQAVAKALRIPESPGLSIVEEVVEHLREIKLLLVLDNCEHLIEACAALVERLLNDCPEMTILATSREALGVPGEKAWRLPSLSLPGEVPLLDSHNIFESEAVCLFIERAGEVVPGYQPREAEAGTVGQICSQLGGIPLAIELAAARMNLLSAQEIADRLNNRFSLLTGGRRTALPRHQTLWAAIEWSYDLLGETERVLFHRLSVFAGSFSLEAAEAMCADEKIPGDEVLTLLGRLVDKSLLNVEPAAAHKIISTRYRFLDTIRSFGCLMLDEAQESRWMRDQHAVYYVQLVESAEPKLLEQDQGYWYRLLQAENDNIRAVIEWSIESDQAENGLRMVGDLLWFWWSHGSTREGIDLATKVLALPSVTHHPKYLGRAFNTAGYLQWVLGDIPSARRSVDNALFFLKKTNDEAGLVWSLQFLGLVLTSEREYELADEAMKEGVALARKLGDFNHSSFSLAFQGDIALQQGNLIKAQSVYEECADLLKGLGNKLFQAYPLRRLGYLALERNEIQQAGNYFRQSLSLNAEGGDRRAVAACLTSLVVLAMRLNKPLAAVRLYGVIENRLESLEANLLYMDQAELERVRSQLRSTLDISNFAVPFMEGWEMTEEQVIELVDDVYRARDASGPQESGQTG
jgi:predicted ATPase/DNA-binding SARP family transcriptional activator